MEKSETDKNEEMLNDVQFQGRNQKIKEMTEEYFCNLCRENKILELFLDNKTTHEEIIKRLFPLLFIMHKNNYGQTTKNEKEIDSKYVFSRLFTKLKESEQNNESLWKIILSDIILEFAEKLDPDEKNHVFGLIKKYFEETAVKKNAKIIQLIDFIINYSVKCINSKVNTPNEKEKDIIYDNERNNKNENERILKSSFNENKFYCLELLISHLTDKNKINDFEINSELKKSFINTCIEGIIEILKNIKSNDEIIKIIFIRIINAIISSINTINNIDLIEKMFKLDIKKNTKEGIDKYCKEKSIIKEIHKELFMYIKNSTEGNEKENKIEIEKRIDLIFLLIENGVSISNDEFKILFYEISKINEITKQILYKNERKYFENKYKVKRIYF